MTITWGGSSGRTFTDALGLANTSDSTIQYVGTESTSISTWPGTVPSSFPLTFETSGGALFFSGIPSALDSPVFNGVTLGGPSEVASLTLNDGRIDNLEMNESSATLRVNNSVISGLLCDCKEVIINTCSTMTSATYGVLLQGTTSCWILNSTITGSAYHGVRMESGGSLLISRGTVTSTGLDGSTWGVYAYTGSAVIFDSVVLGNNYAVMLENPITIFQSCTIMANAPPSDDNAMATVIDCLGLLAIFNDCRFEMSPTARAGVFLKQHVSNAKWLSSRNTFKLNGFEAGDVVKFESGPHAGAPPPQPVITAVVKASNRLSITSSLTGTLNLSTTDGHLVAGELNVLAGVPITIFAKSPFSPMVSVFSTDQSSLPMLVTPSPGLSVTPLPPLPPPSPKNTEKEAGMIAIVGVVALTLVIAGSSAAFMD